MLTRPQLNLKGIPQQRTVVIGRPTDPSSLPFKIHNIDLTAMSDEITGAWALERHCQYFHLLITLFFCVSFVLSILIVSDVMNNIVSDMMFRCCPINQRSHERSNVKLMRRCRLISFQDELFSSHEHQCIRALGLPLQAIFVWRKTWLGFQCSDINIILDALKLHVK